MICNWDKSLKADFYSLNTQSEYSDIFYTYVTYPHNFIGYTNIYCYRLFDLCGYVYVNGLCDSDFKEQIYFLKILSVMQVTVLMPIYNAEKYLRDAIDSPYFVKLPRIGS